MLWQDWPVDVNYAFERRLEHVVLHPWYEEFPQWCPTHPSFSYQNALPASTGRYHPNCPLCIVHVWRVGAGSATSRCNVYALSNQQLTAIQEHIDIVYLKCWYLILYSWSHMTQIWVVSPYKELMKSNSFRYLKLSSRMCSPYERLVPILSGVFAPILLQLWRQHY